MQTGSATSSPLSQGRALISPKKIVPSVAVAVISSPTRSTADDDGLSSTLPSERQHPAARQDASPLPRTSSGRSSNPDTNGGGSSSSLLRKKPSDGGSAAVVGSTSHGAYRISDESDEDVVVSLTDAGARDCTPERVNTAPEQRSHNNGGIASSRSQRPFVREQEMPTSQQQQHYYQRMTPRSTHATDDTTSAYYQRPTTQTTKELLMGSQSPLAAGPTTTPASYHHRPAVTAPSFGSPMGTIVNVPGYGASASFFCDVEHVPLSLSHRSEAFHRASRSPLSPDKRSVGVAVGGTALSSGGASDAAVAGVMREASVGGLSYELTHRSRLDPTQFTPATVSTASLSGPPRFSSEVLRISSPGNGNRLRNEGGRTSALRDSPRPDSLAISLGSPARVGGGGYRQPPGNVTSAHRGSGSSPAHPSSPPPSRAIGSGSGRRAVELLSTPAGGVQDHQSSSAGGSPGWSSMVAVRSADSLRNGCTDAPLTPRQYPDREGSAVCTVGGGTFVAGYDYDTRIRMHRPSDNSAVAVNPGGFYSKLQDRATPGRRTMSPVDRTPRRAEAA